METALVHDLLAAIPVPVLALDRDQRITAANAAAYTLFGGTLVDRPFVNVLRQPPILEAVDTVLDPARRADTPGEATPGGHRIRAEISALGRDVPCEVTVSPLGSTGGALVVIEERSEIEQAEEMRRNFVANVSHELRTPLTALMGFIETLSGPARDDATARARFLSIMEREASRMNRLVMDLLSLSRVEAEERRRPAESLDLAALLRGVVTTLTPQAQKEGIALTLHGADHQAPIIADSDQLVQVFQNLIENAIKYGGGGKSVSVRLSHLDYEPNLRGQAWAVAVADKGEGIEERHVPRLTERFYRVDNHRSRAQGGTGLGLAIVKHIVNRHRGRLRIESTRGAGSTFTVILPERQERVKGPLR